RCDRRVSEHLDSVFFETVIVTHFARKRSPSNTYAFPERTSGLTSAKIKSRSSGLWSTRKSDNQLTTMILLEYMHNQNIQL
ncbi:hypothetical protein ACC848_43415, partial [Rhizobium johnstonii]